MPPFAAKKRTVLLAAVAILVAVALGPYLVSRARSVGRRVRVRPAANVDSVVSETTAARLILRVATYNIAHGRGPTDDNWAEPGDEKPQRIDEIARLLKDTGADVVVLNEIDFSSTWSGHQNQAEAIAKAAGFSHWAEQRNLDFRFIYGSWKFGNAVLSKYPIVETELVEFPAFAAWEDSLAGHKRGVVCTLQISPHRQVRVLAVHLETRSADIRVNSAQVIVELAGSSEIPLIVAGDFNSTPIDFPKSDTTADGRNAMGVLADSGRFQLHPRSPPSPAEMTYPSDNPRSVIDWILIPSGWRFSSYRVLDSPLSDHRPVVATIELGD